MIISSVCHGFYTTVEGFLCTEFGCAVRIALLAEFQAHLSFLLLFFKYSVLFLKQICLRHQSMDCFSPCRPLLPFWLGKGVATPLRGSPDSARFGFSPWAVVVPRFCSAILSPRFLLGISTRPYLPSCSWPSHLCSAFPCPSGRRWVAVPKPARRGALNELKVWQLCASDRANEQVQRWLPLLGILCCPHPVLPACQWLAPPKQPRPRSCGQKKLCSVGCAVSFCHVFGN